MASDLASLNDPKLLSGEEVEFLTQLHSQTYVEYVSQGAEPVLELVVVFAIK